MAIGFCVWAALLTTYTIGNRTVAAVAALLAMMALAAIAQAVLLTYQRQARGGTAVTTNLEFRQRGLKAAFIGDDGRASTSKTGIVVWTGAVVTALIYLLLLSRTVPGQSLFLGALNQNLASRIPGPARSAGGRGHRRGRGRQDKQPRAGTRSHFRR